MVMPECLPSSLPSSPEGPASAASVGRVVAAAEFTAGSRRRSFTAKYKLQILSETDRAVDTGAFHGRRALIPRDRGQPDACRRNPPETYPCSVMKVASF